MNVHSSYTRTCNLQLQTKFLDHISDGISLVTGDVSQCNLHVELPRILLVPGHHECPRHLLTLHQGELIVQVEHGLRPVGGDTPGYNTVQYSTVQYGTVQYSNTPGGRRELHHAVTLAEGYVEEGRESLETRIIF